MNMLEDPDMAEVVTEFTEESSTIYTKLEELLEAYEDGPSGALLEEFGQTIDRVMGAAKSLEANIIGTYCDLGKTISYKASQVDDPELLNIVLAVLFDTVEVLQRMNTNVEVNKKEELKDFNSEAFGKRLAWLSDKFKSIQRSSVAIEDGEQEASETKDQGSIDDLLKELGL